MGLMRVRTAVLGAAGVVLALMAGRIFDEPQWELVVAALVPAVVGVIVVGRAWWVRTSWCAGAALVGVSITVLLAGGDVPGDVLTAFIDGPQRLMSTEWPSPVQPDLVATVAAGLAVAVALSVGLSGTRRWHLLPVLPLVVEFVAISAASAPAGAPTGWLLPLGFLVLIAALLRPEGPARDQLRLLRGERRVIAVGAVAAVAGVLVAVPVAFAERADPRRDDPAERTSPVVDPIEATTALQGLEPPIDVYRVAGAAVVPDRWRIAALDRYDGERWAPTITLRPIGRRLGPDVGGATGYEVELATSLIPFVPLPGPPVLVDTPVATDPERTVVQLVEPPTPGQLVSITAATGPARPDASRGTIATRPIDEISSSFTELATELAGDGTVLDQLSRLEQTLATDYELDPGAPGGGMQQELIERFLVVTQRGNAEQFATSFVLLARSLGVDARIATGFVAAGSEGDDGGPLALRSDEATVWPEVRVEGVGWVPFDPVPEEVTTAPEESEPPPRAQTPAAPQPPVDPPAEQDAPADEPPTPQDEDESSVWSAVAVWAGRVATVLAVVLLPLAIAVAVILGLKHRRRVRRLAVSSPTERIRGAWAVTTDALVDAGLTIRPSWTDNQIAAHGARFAAGAEHDIARLGALSSTATFGPRDLATAAGTQLLADDAVATLTHVETTMADDRNWWRRWRWRLSLRSLRPSTRSPVLGTR